MIMFGRRYGTSRNASSWCSRSKIKRWYFWKHWWVWPSNTVIAWLIAFTCPEIWLKLHLSILKRLVCSHSFLNIDNCRCNDSSFVSLQLTPAICLLINLLISMFFNYAGSFPTCWTYILFIYSYFFFPLGFLLSGVESMIVDFVLLV